MFVVDGAGYAHIHVRLKIGFWTTRGVYYRRRVTANDKILLSGVQKVHDGQHVKTRYYTPVAHEACSTECH